MEPCIHDSIGRWAEWRDSFASAHCADKCSPPSRLRRQHSSALHLYFRVSHHANRKVQNPQKRILDFWSEWRDSNSRHPGPKWGQKLTLNPFRSVWDALLRKSCSLKLLPPLSPCTPNPVMVKYVVKNRFSDI